MTKFFGYIAVCVSTFMIFVWVTEIYQIDLSVPLAYSGDTLECISFIKKIITGDKWGHLYAPFQIDYQQPRWIFVINFILQPFMVAELRLISLFTEDPVKILNIYYLLTYLLTPLTFAYVMRCYKVGWCWTITFSSLYTLLPYHFMRNVWHLWVASYYLIPLYVLILLWTWKAVPIFFKYEANKFKVCLVNKKSIFAFVVLVILSPTAKYYIFIFSYLIVIAGIGASFYRNNSRHLITALILVLMAMFSIVKLQIPFWLENRNEHFCEQIQRIKPGQNISSYGDAERYGLKIVQMLLPVDNHRIDKLALLKNRYNKSNPLINENSTATLGIIGSIGFVFLMFGVLQHKKRLDILQKLGLLTIFSILFATIGGGSSLFSTLTYTFIPESFLTSSRSFNRISIYIACFSLVTMAYVLHKTFCGSKKKHVIAVLLSFLLLVIGVFDQTNLTMKITSGYRAAAREYESDRAFFNLVEKTVGHGAMIFQLPYLAHHRRLNKTLCYTDALKGYINTNSLIWSHGGDYDSYHGYWYRKISRLPAEEMIDLLRVYGFKGVVVDRKGYKKNKNAIEKELYRTLNSKPVISKNNRLVFFKIETKGKINVAQKKKINMKIYSEFLSKR